ncbi:MAG: helix-hairpin-helix domain-containing protein [Byssovorax sp.]
MEARAAKKKDRTPTPKAESRGALGRMRAAIADSPWGALAGKGVLAAAGFVLLALVGSGRLGGAAPRLGIAEAAAATPSASASASIKAPPSPDASASASASATAVTDPPADAGAPGDPRDGGGPAVTPDGKVALNLATEEDLRRLPGIGATRAKAILALRERLGRFRRPEDLLRVKGIGRRSLARLRPLLIVEP